MRTCVRVVRASEFTRLDSDVILGGGTDDTQALQAILDTASEGRGLHLVMDGAALTTGLDVGSNTTIECLNRSCGFFLAPGANRSIIRNAHPDRAGVQDRNITLAGGTYNHNAAGQLHHIGLDESTGGAFGAERWVIAMEFYGVAHLTMRGLTIRNQRTFAMLAANWHHVTIEDVTIELPDNMHGQNQDGLHFWGPGQFLSIRNIAGTSGDDFIALAPDEDDSVSSITDVVIDGVFLDDADQGIRLLSRDSGCLDRVHIRNVSGTFKSFGFYINPWFPGAAGNFGHITIEHVELRQTTHKYTYTNPFLFRIGGRVEALVLRDVAHHATNSMALAEVGIPFYTADEADGSAYSHVGLLCIEGLKVFDTEGRLADMPHIRLMCPIDTLVLRDSYVAGGGSGALSRAALVETSAHADIGCLHVTGLTLHSAGPLLHHAAGSIESLAVHDLLCSGSCGPLVTGQGRVGSSSAVGVVGRPAF